MPVFVSVFRVTVRNRIPRDATLDVVMLFQGSNNVLKCSVIRVCYLAVDSFTKLRFKGFLALFRYLPLCESLLDGLTGIEIFPNGFPKICPLALFTEITRHLIEITPSTAKRFTRFTIDIPDNKMRVDMVTVDVYGEKHVVSLFMKKLLRKLF